MIQYRLIGPGTMLGYLANQKLDPTDANSELHTPVYTLIKNRPATDINAEIFFKHLDAGGETNFNPENAIGAANIAYIDYLIAEHTDLKDKTILTVFKSLCESYAAQEVEDPPAVEYLGLVQNNEQHVINLNLSASLAKQQAIKIEQRFGPNAGDLTEWHDCAQFTNVHYKQLSYKCQVPASPTTYRELRLVNNTGVTLSIS